MQNRAQSLNSHIEDFQILKMNYDRLTECGSKSGQVDDRNSLSCSIDSEVRDEVCESRFPINALLMESLEKEFQGLNIRQMF